MGVVVRSYHQSASLLSLLGLEEESGRSDGLSFAWKGQSYILYNSSRAFRRIRFTVAHELGHCLLHHDGGIRGSSLLQINVCQQTQMIEQQANTFAADLLAPACVLWGLGVTTAEQIASCCQISLEAGRIRLARLNRLRQRDAQIQRERRHSCFLSSPLERRVFHQFLPYMVEQNANLKIWTVDLPNR